MNTIDANTTPMMFSERFALRKKYLALTTVVVKKMPHKSMAKRAKMAESCINPAHSVMTKPMYRKTAMRNVKSALSMDDSF